MEYRLECREADDSWRGAPLCAVVTERIGIEKPRAKSTASDWTNKNSNRMRARPRYKPAKNLGTREPDLLMLLGEPEVRLLMRGR